MSANMGAKTRGRLSALRNCPRHKDDAVCLSRSFCSHDLRPGSRRFSGDIGFFSTVIDLFEDEPTLGYRYDRNFITFAIPSKYTFPFNLTADLLMRSTQTVHRRWRVAPGNLYRNCHASHILAHGYLDTYQNCLVSRVKFYGEVAPSMNAHSHMALAMLLEVCPALPIKLLLIMLTGFLFSFSLSPREICIAFKLIG